MLLADHSTYWVKILWPVWHTSLETANLRTVIIVFRGIASLKTITYLSGIQTFKLKAAEIYELSVMGIFFKGVFLLFPWLFSHSSRFLFWRIVWIGMITCIRHKHIQKLPGESETNRKFFRPNGLFSYPSNSNEWTVILCYFLLCLVF